MATEIRDASGALIGHQLEHTAQQVDDGLEAVNTKAAQTDLETLSGRVDTVDTEVDGLKSHIDPFFSDDELHTFSGVGGFTTGIYLDAGKTYKIQNISPYDLNQVFGVFIEGHSDQHVSIGSKIGDSELFTPSNSGNLRIYNNSGAVTIGVKVYGEYDTKIDQLQTDIVANSYNQIIPSMYKSYDLRKIEGKTAGKNLLSPVSYTMENIKAPTLGDSTIASVSPVLPVRDANGNQILFISGTFNSSFSALCARFFKKDGYALSDFRLNSGTFSIPNDAYYVILSLYNDESICKWRLIPQGTALYTPVEYHVGGGLDFETVTEALIAIDGDETPKTVYVHAGVYDIYAEMGGDNYFNSLPQLVPTDWRTYCHLIPPNTTIKGIGNVVLQFNMQETDKNTKVFSCLNATNSVKIENLTIMQTGGRYAIHLEGATTPNTVGNEYTIKDVNIECSISNPAIGIGMNQQTVLKLINVDVNNTKGGAFYHHTNHHLTEKIEFENCIFRQRVDLQNWAGSAQGGNGVKTSFKNCYIDSLRLYSTDAGATVSDYVVTLMNCNNITPASQYVTPDVTVYNSIS